MLDVDNRQTIYRWVQEFQASGEKAFDNKSVLPGDELKRLQKEKADLRMENEILKKLPHILRNTIAKGRICCTKAYSIPCQQSNCFRLYYLQSMTIGTIHAKTIRIRKPNKQPYMKRSCNTMEASETNAKAYP